MDSILGLLPILLIFIVMYFFFLRPQIQKQKQQTNFQNTLDKGKDVVTTGGIVGRISKIEDDIITLQVDARTFIKFHKSAVSKEMTEGVKIPQGYLN